MRVLILFLCLLGVMPLAIGAERKCPEQIHNSHECFLYREAQLSKHYSRLIHRKNGTLSVRLTNGSYKTFRDISPNDSYDNVEKIIGYAVVGYFPKIRYCLIATQFWEGNSYLLMSTVSGAAIDIGGEVLLSPDRRRLAVWNADIWAGYSPNVLAIYNVSTSRPVLEFSDRPEAWGPEDPFWIDNRTVGFFKIYHGDGEEVRERMTLRMQRHSSAGRPIWQVE